jgi:hypothetical protein
MRVRGIGVQENGVPIFRFSFEDFVVRPFALSKHFGSVAAS